MAAGLLLALGAWLGPLAPSLAADPSAPAVDVSTLVPAAEHRRATRVILDLMRRYHYRKVEVDDELSQRVFDRYLKSLDPNRSFFLAADIEEFSHYRDQLDEALRYAQLEPAFEIFKRLRERTAERVEFAARQLEHEFEFTSREEYRFDREDATWADSPETLDDIWRRRVKNDVLELRLAGRTPEQIRDTLGKRFGRMGRRVNQLDANDVYQFFINAYTVTIEPHTAYFSPRTSENFKIRMSLSLEGIGAALQTENEHTVVRRIIEGGPAALSKQLKVNDRIVGVGQGDDGELVDVISWRLEDVVDLIRGPKSSVVRLAVLTAKTPPGTPPKTVALVRDKINLDERAAKRSTVKAELGGREVAIGVIDVPTFYLDSVGRAEGKPDYRSTTRDVRRLLEELQADGVAGVVVDLRGNSGGSLVEATELTGLFIESGPVVQIRDARGRLQINADPDPSVAYHGPLGVLVDGRSASASEIFAAAIQDYRRGVLLGEPTFGKGTVQNLFDLDRRGGLGQLKVTIAQFFRINGEGTQHRGVIPDILFPTAADAESHGERALENALPWASVTPTSYAPYSLSGEPFVRARARHLERVSRDPRFELLVAEIASQKRIRDLKSVSLVEDERRAEWDSRQRELKERENLYRKALGIAADSEDDPGSDVEAGPEGAAQNEGPDAVPEAADILLEEAAQVLADIIGKETPRVASSG